MTCSTVSHSINKCTLFLACLWRQHQRQKHSRHATRHVLFLITDGDRVYPDIKIKSILEETSKLKKLNPIHQGTQPQSYRPPLPSDTTLVPHRPHRPALTAWERRFKQPNKKTINYGDLCGLCSNADQLWAGFFKYPEGFFFGNISFKIGDYPFHI